MNFDPSKLNHSLLVGLSNAAQYFVTRMKDKRAQQRLPSVIDDATSIDPPQVSEGNASINVVIDLKKAPMAAAFEWGSGIHGKEGKRYKIAPKEAEQIAFPIERWPNYQPPPNVSMAIFPGAISKKPYVMHPGVAARPYITPALRASLPEIKKIIGKEVKAAIVVGGITVIKA